MPHLDEGTIHAWLDGALSPAEAGAVETHVASCAECSAAVAEARGLIAAASRILQGLDDVPGDVMPSVARPAWYRRTGVRAAAGFLIVAAGSMWATRSWRASGTEHVALRSGGRDVASAQRDMSLPAPVTSRVADSTMSANAASNAASIGESVASPMMAKGAPGSSGVSNAAVGGAAATQAMREANGVMARKQMADSRPMSSEPAPVMMSPAPMSAAADAAPQDRVAAGNVAPEAPAPPARKAAPQLFAKSAPSAAAGALSTVMPTAVKPSLALAASVNDSMPTLVRQVTCDSVEVTEYVLRDGAHVSLFSSASAIDVSRAELCVVRANATAMAARRMKSAVANTADSSVAANRDARKSVAPSALPWTAKGTGHHYVLYGSVPITTLGDVRRLLKLPE